MQLTYLGEQSCSAAGARFFFSVLLGDPFRPAERTAKQMCFESYVNGSVHQRIGSFVGTNRSTCSTLGTVYFILTVQK